MTIYGRVKQVKLASTGSSKKVIMENGNEFYVSPNETVEPLMVIEADLEFRGMGYNRKEIMFCKNVKYKL